jgi:DNA-binding GntR family transcriptional regulator
MGGALSRLGPPVGLQARYTSKTELVTSALRELILAGEFEPGDPLRQRDIAARLGVSATPVREALRRLESEGLVRIDLHRGATVAESTLGPVEENALIRAALESLAVEMAAGRITPAQLDRVEAVNARIAALGEDDERYGSLNRDFHFAVYEAAGSPVLLSLMQLLWRAMPEGPKVLRPHSASAQEHAELIAALRAGDAGRASRLIRRHIVASPHLPAERGARPAGHERDTLPPPDTAS